MHKVDGLRAASLTERLDQNPTSGNTSPFDLDVLFAVDVDFDVDAFLAAL